jgi:uncharacterized protein YlbG (UPF0298 family)
MEVFKTIENTNGMYQVSDLGNVKSFHRSSNGKILKFGTIKKRVGAYRFVNIYMNGIMVNTTIHRLVASYFVENPNGYNEVNHIDGNKENNKAENLEWCSRKQNAKHAADNLLYKVGENHPSCKLSEYDVIEIYTLYHFHGFSTVAICKLYGVNDHSISKIVNGKTWKHVTKNINMKKRMAGLKRSEKLTAAEFKAFIKWIGSFDTKTEAAESLGVGRNTLHMISHSGSASPETVKLIRKAISKVQSHINNAA